MTECLKNNEIIHRNQDIDELLSETTAIWQATFTFQIVLNFSTSR